MRFQGGYDVTAALRDAIVSSGRKGRLPLKTTEQQQNNEKPGESKRVSAALHGKRQWGPLLEEEK
jgi:hypothetical protein